MVSAGKKTGIYLLVLVPLHDIPVYASEYNVHKKVHIHTGGSALSKCCWISVAPVAQSVSAPYL